MRVVQNSRDIQEILCTLSKILIKNNTSDFNIDSRDDAKCLTLINLDFVWKKTGELMMLCRSLHVRASMTHVASSACFFHSHNV